jgi:hypothetical protein
MPSDKGSVFGKEAIYTEDELREEHGSDERLVGIDTAPKLEERLRRPEEVALCLGVEAQYFFASTL